MEGVIAKPILHKGEKRIKLEFNCYNSIIEKVKELPGRKYSRTLGCWHIPFSKLNCNRFNLKVDLFEIEEGKRQKKSGGLKENETKNSDHNIQNEIVTTLELDEYNQLIFIKFQYNEDVKNDIKKLTGAWWHPGAKKWSVHYDDDNLNRLKEIFQKQGENVSIKRRDNNLKRKNYARIAADYSKVPIHFVNELRLQNRSENTIKTYRAAVAAFLEFYKEKSPEAITLEEIRDYILEFRFNQKYSPAFQNQVISALKSFYRIEYLKELDGNLLPRPKKTRQLPRVISKEEIEALMFHTKNPKHKLILMLMYGAGLRIGEVVNLKITDIDLNRMQIHIFNSKGRKDRTINLTEKLNTFIKRYLVDYAPNEMLFNGQGKIKYSAESISKMIKNSAKKAGIRKKISAHVLRHCYATHMLEKGVDIRYIQVLLGHKSSRTTEIYTHVSNNKISELGSPIDDINV